MIKRFVVFLGIFMTLAFISNIQFNKGYLAEEHDKIEWNNYEVVESV